MKNDKDNNEAAHHNLDITYINIGSKGVALD